MVASNKMQMVLCYENSIAVSKAGQQLP